MKDFGIALIDLLNEHGISFNVSTDISGHVHIECDEANVSITQRLSDIQLLSQELRKAEKFRKYVNNWMAEGNRIIQGEQ